MHGKGTCNMSPRALEWGLNSEEKGDWKSRCAEAVWTACMRCNCSGAGSVKLDPLESSWPVGGHPCERMSWTKGCLELLLCCLQPHGVALSFCPPLYAFICSFLPAIPSLGISSPCGFGGATALSSCGFSVNCNQINLSASLSSFVPDCLIKIFNQLKVLKGVQLALMQKRKTFHL